MACLRAKKFLIFHHSAPFVMENCTIYQTSETSLWENVARLVKRTVQSLIIWGYAQVNELKNLVCFMLLRFDSVWFRQFEKWVIVDYTVIKILSWMGRAHSVLSMMIYSSSEDQWQFIFHWIHVSLISPLWPPTSSDNACQTKLQHNPYPFTFKLLAIKALNINGPV